MKISTILIIFFLCFWVISCQKPSKCFHETGEETKEIRVLRSFKGVKINSLMDVFWHYDTTYKVEIQCGKKLLPFIETRQANDYLIISNFNKCNWLRKYRRIKMHIYSPSLTELIIVGSGDYFFVDTLASDSFKINNWADISKIDAKVRCRWFAYTQHAGTGDTYLSGYAGISFLWISGMGYLHAKNLKANYNYITNKSTGNAYAYATKEAGVYIFKSGNVYLYGSPDTVIEKIYGIGNIIRIN
ncbi:MAG: DUF2807 domain-containing protein [Bacteroidales bacterium]|nr:DUF2807 domain-containing protein [Bacteroidales bacterium]